MGTIFMTFGLYVVVGLVLALMNLIEDRHCEYENLSSDWGAQTCVVGFYAVMWPLILIGYVFYKLSR